MRPTEEYDTQNGYSATLADIAMALQEWYNGPTDNRRTDDRPEITARALDDLDSRQIEFFPFVASGAWQEDDKRRIIAIHRGRGGIQLDSQRIIGNVPIGYNAARRVAYLHAPMCRCDVVCRGDYNECAPEFYWSRWVPIDDNPCFTVVEYECLHAINFHSTAPENALRIQLAPDVPAWSTVHNEMIPVIAIVIRDRSTLAVVDVQVYERCVIYWNHSMPGINGGLNLIMSYHNAFHVSSLDSIVGLVKDSITVVELPV